MNPKKTYWSRKSISGVRAEERKSRIDQCEMLLGQWAIPGYFMIIHLSKSADCAPRVNPKVYRLFEIMMCQWWSSLSECGLKTLWNSLKLWSLIMNKTSLKIVSHFLETRVSLCGHGWPRTHCRELVSLKLIEICLFLLPSAGAKGRIHHAWLVTVFKWHLVGRVPSSQPLRVGDCFLLGQIPR